MISAPVRVVEVGVSVVLAEGKHPVPSRTRKLSPPAPMVLHGRLCGRVGHRRTQRKRREGPATRRGLFSITGARAGIGGVQGEVAAAPAGLQGPARALT